MHLQAENFAIKCEDCTSATSNQKTSLLNVKIIKLKIVSCPKTV